MDPNNPHPQDPMPSIPQPAVPVNPSAGSEVPVFRNPLAQGYENSTTQLPPMQPAAPMPQPPYQPQDPSPTNPPTVADSGSAQISPQPTANSSGQQPMVSELSDLPMRPAPVRLAPVPRGDDLHAGGLQNSSQSMPFNTAVASNIPSPVPPANPSINTPKRKPIGLIVGIAVGIVLLLVSGIGGYAYLRLRKSKPSGEVNESIAVKSVRDRVERPVQPFSERISTDCYIAQALTPVETQQNKDCALSITYGEQKISSIFVSALGQFDVTTDSATTNSAQNTGGNIDTKKYLEALIVDIIPKDLVTTREDVKVGGLEATKVVGKKDATSGVDVAYAFIILPEGDKAFGEKTFVAFIVTGAYNDDYSRKGFNQFLSTWSWK